MHDASEPIDSDALFAQFLRAHPEGGTQDFEGWLQGCSAAASDVSLAARLRSAYEAWSATQAFLAPPECDTEVTFFGRRGEHKEGHSNREAAHHHPGRKIGRFVLSEFIARGGMGQVWRAKDTDLRRDVALKLMLPERLDTRALELFAREARAGGRLNHPNVVATHAYGNDGGLAWIAQELVDGSWTLKDVLDDLRAADRVPEGYYRHVADLVAQLADALQAAHDAGVIHRDVKPANVLIAPDDQPKLTDFGLARISDSPLLSATGEFAGTWSYMSPEQVTARRMGLDHRTDVFSLGVVLYELLALRRPFEGDTTHQIAEKIISFEPPNASKVRSQCPRELAVICGMALEKAPGDRYQSAFEFAADLRRHISNEPILARPPGATARAVKWIQRNVVISLAAAGALLALGIVSVLLLLRAADARELAQLARSNEQLAEQRAEEALVAEASAKEARDAEALAEAERYRAEQERAGVLRLSAQQDLADLLEEQRALWPPYPDNIEALRSWITAAEELIADLPLHLAKRDELRALALPLSKDERETQRRAHPKFGHLQRFEAELASKRHALAVRQGNATLELPAVDRSTMPEDRSAWNWIAWRLVKPDREKAGDEARGIAIATDALTTAIDDQRASIRNTIAWGRLAMGDDEGALEASRAALAAAGENSAKEYQGFLNEVRAAVEVARSETGLAAAAEEIAALEAQVADVGADVDQRVLWTFPESQESARWWNAQLTHLIEGLDALDHDLMAPGAVTSEHGWSMAKRLAFAESLAVQFAEGSEHADAWAEALPKIRASHPSLAELTPKMGLLPIGPDPDSGLWEFSHLATGTPAARGEDGQLTLTEETGLVLVLIPGGTFVMGAQSTDPSGRSYDVRAKPEESPPHGIRLSPYCISKYEFTQAQWRRVTGANPSLFCVSSIVQNEMHPVESISQANALEALSRFDLSLPSEAQWEYAARAGDHRGFETEWRDGSSVPPFNSADKSAHDKGATWSDIGEWPTYSDGYPLHAPVGSFPPNRYGIYDMAGNVREWCLDAFSKVAYRSHSMIDPLVAESTTRTFVFRGGAFRFPASRWRATARAHQAARYQDAFTGVRPSFSISLDEAR